MSSPFHLNQSPFGLAKILILVGFAVVAYMLYALTLSVYRNYQLDQHIKNFEARNQQLEQEISSKKADADYYSSEAYLDKVAKQSLGLINPGEKVIVLPPVDTVAIPEEEIMKEREIKMMQEMPNPRKWWKFFFEENMFKG